MLMELNFQGSPTASGQMATSTQILTLTLEPSISRLWRTESHGTCYVFNVYNMRLTVNCSYNLNCKANAFSGNLLNTGSSSGSIYEYYCSTLMGNLHSSSQTLNSEKHFELTKPTLRFKRKNLKADTS